MEKIRLIEEQYVRKDLPQFNVGDTVRVWVKIPEGPDKIRLHSFEGVVIAKKGSKNKEAFTVRRISYGEGIERVFLLNSPAISQIEIIRRGKVKRAKLYYLREKVGKKATRIEEKEDNAAKKEIADSLDSQK